MGAGLPFAAVRFDGMKMVRLLRFLTAHLPRLEMAARRLFRQHVAAPLLAACVLAVPPAAPRDLRGAGVLNVPALNAVSNRRHQPTSLTFSESCVAAHRQL